MPTSEESRTSWPTMSHEIRTPMNAIMGMAATLETSRAPAGAGALPERSSLRARITCS